jgi:N-acyl-D-aspartate/D-glutamate deacylase
VNVIYLVPNGNLRLTVASSVDRPSTRDELREMKRLLAAGMDEGAWGYSTGLEYAPERACPEQEIAELCRVAADKGGFYATHTRNRHGEATQTIEEAIRTAEAANIPLQISHISSITRLTDTGRAALEQAMRMVDDACARGHDVAFDMHTRLFGLTNLSAVLPPSVIQGSKQQLEASLRSPSLRAELRSRPSIVMSLARGDWSRIVLYNCRSHPQLARKSLAEISEARGQDVFDTICEILLDEIDDLHGAMVLGYAYDEADMRMVFDHPDCMVGSDATALAPDGPLRSSFFHGAYTWAAWFFRHFVQEKRQMTLAEAIRRLTGLPAKRLRLDDRGSLRAGAFADIAIFDPALFAERGTTFEPNRLAEGMRHVIVNGRATLRDGKPTGTRSGQVLRH